MGLPPRAPPLRAVEGHLTELAPGCGSGKRRGRHHRLHPQGQVVRHGDGHGLGQRRGHRAIGRSHGHGPSLLVAAPQGDQHAGGGRPGPCWRRAPPGLRARRSEPPRPGCSAPRTCPRGCSRSSGRRRCHHSATSPRWERIAQNAWLSSRSVSTASHVVSTWWNRSSAQQAWPDPGCRVQDRQPGGDHHDGARAGAGVAHAPEVATSHPHPSECGVPRPPKGRFRARFADGRPVELHARDRPERRPGTPHSLRGREGRGRARRRRRVVVGRPARPPPRPPGSARRRPGRRDRGGRPSARRARRPRPVRAAR